MTDPEILAGIQAVAREHVGFEGELRPELRLVEDLGLDSMQSMELLSRVSEEFEVDPDMEKVMKVNTVEEVVSVLAGTIGAA